MAQNTIQRKITITAVYQPLSSGPVDVGTFDVSAPPTNVANVFFLGDDGVTDVPWIPGEFHNFVDVRLSEIQVKGTPADIVTVVGGSW